MSAVTTKHGTRGCVVLAGILRDPYTGATIAFTKADAGQVAIDHIYPLAAAWDLGAWSWSSQQRRNFANDPRNLLPTARGVNASKGDKTPQGWAPPTAGGRCLYASRYAAVAAAYGLPVTESDLRALRLDLSDC
ncbi:MAG: HNH endonuclease family protein [Intrasporangium sp.]|nr:HNH endonuclease family protein [Intrasporangium sp.]